MTRPTAYPPRRRPNPAPVNVAASLAFQAPPTETMPSHGQDPAPAAEGLPEGQGARLGQERAALLARLAEASTPSRNLVELILAAEGPSALSTDALRRACRILDVIEAPADEAND